MKKYLCIVNFKSKKVVKKLDVSDKSTNSIDRIENGMNINLNHDEYYTQVMNEKEVAKHGEE